jgi:hypothetical protein
LDDVRLPIDSTLVQDVIKAPSAPSVRPPASETPTSPTVTSTLPTPGRVPALERLNKYNKFLTTPREKLELERLAARVSGALGVSVRSSQLIRACLIHLLHAEAQIIQRATECPSPKRPSNSETVALAEFDHLLADLLWYAFRDAGPIQSAGGEPVDEAV